MLHRKHGHHHGHHLHHHERKISSPQPNHNQIQTNMVSPQVNNNILNHPSNNMASIHQNHNSQNHHSNNMASIQPTQDHHRGINVASPQADHHHGHSMASAHPAGNLRPNNADNIAIVQTNEHHHHHGNSTAANYPNEQGLNYNQNPLQNNLANITPGPSAYHQTTTRAGVWKTIDSTYLRVNNIDLIQSIRDPHQRHDQIQHFHVDTQHNPPTQPNTPSNNMGISFSQSVTVANDRHVNGRHQSVKPVTPDIPKVTSVCEDVDARCPSWAYLCGADWSVKTVCPKSCQICHVNAI